MFRLILLTLLLSCSLGIEAYRIRYIFYCTNLTDIYISKPYYKLEKALEKANNTSDIPKPLCECDSLKIFVVGKHIDTLIQKAVCVN